MPRLSFPPVVRTLVAANLAVYTLMTALRIPELGEHLALVCPLVLKDHAWWRLGTSLFVHWSLLQLGVNMAFLAVFGGLVESAWGGRRFLTYYLVCGIGGGLAVLLLDWHGTGTVGATPSVLGVVMAFALLPGPRRNVFLAIGVAALALVLSKDGSTWDGQLDWVAHLSLCSGPCFGLAYHRYQWLGRIYLHRLTRSPGEGLRLEASSLDPPASEKRRQDLPDERKVDAVLDKIARDGLSSLSAEERHLLEQASRRLRESDR